MDIDVRDTGPAPLIVALARELGIVESINEIVKWDEKQCFIDPGTHLAMVIDILLGLSPLYRVEKNYAEIDVELIFGRGFVLSLIYHLESIYQHLVQENTPAFFLVVMPFVSSLCFEQSLSFVSFGQPEWR